MPTLSDPRWSLEYLHQTFRPHLSWREWFRQAFMQAMHSKSPEQQLDGWRTAAIIFGDMHAEVLCLIVCLHGLSLTAEDDARFQGHIDLCLMDMGLAVPISQAPDGTLSVKDFGTPGAFRRDDAMFREWMRAQLEPFGGNVCRAAEYAMRLTAIRLGLMSGPREPSIAQVLDGSLWTIEPLACVPSVQRTNVRRRWWQLWR
jgi:hypothetical protein